MHEGYGLTETSPTITVNFVGQPPRPGTVGTPLWGVDVEIAAAETEDRVDILPLGELGEVVARGHNLFKGYLGRPEATRAAIVDGWFRTGDLGTLDADGVLTIIDRKKDMIVRNGYNVDPSEVENVLARHPAVGSVAVFGLADAVHGQEVHAAVVLSRGITVGEAELIARVEARIAAYKFPRHIHFVAELPIGASGKVLKRELVARYTL